jgi:hypothetical protein
MSVLAPNAVVSVKGQGEGGRGGGAAGNGGFGERQRLTQGMLLRGSDLG